LKDKDLRRLWTGIAKISSLFLEGSSFETVKDALQSFDMISNMPCYSRDNALAKLEGF
jgi:hypothetical protein